MPWDETDTQIMTRLRDPGDFRPDSFRNIPIVKTKPRIWGIVGKPRDGGGMALQALRFPKEDGWTLAKAKEWFRVHGSGFKFTEGAMERKAFKFEVKDINEAGEFTGFASVYNVVDKGGDVVEPGAFAKTIAEHGADVPILWSHKSDEPVGLGTLEDTPNGLMIHGKLEMALPEAQSAYVRIKSKIVKGLSIGYEAIKAPVENGVRKLKEIKLYEVSLVLFPMNEFAQITSVKAEAEPDPEAKMLEFADAEIKAGRRLSADTLAAMEEIMRAHQSAIDKLRALMEAGKATPDEGAGKSAAPVEPPAVQPEPDLHSLVEHVNQFPMSI